MTDVLRAHAEQQFAEELEALARADDRPAPAAAGGSRRGRSSTYLLGGEARRAASRSRPKYIGDRRLIEIAVATLATDRALLLLGVPGTAKTWVCRAPRGRDLRRLDAARAGHGRARPRRRSATAGTTRGCSPRGRRARRSSPARSCARWRTGKIARVEELTRIPSDVQDALITILSEKTLPIPELDDEVQAAQGLQRDRDRQQPRPRRQRAVERAASAASTRSCCPLPADDGRGGRDRQQRARRGARPRARAAGRAPGLEEIRRVVTIFRELRGGVTADGKTKLKSPSGHALDRRGDLGRDQRAGARRALRRRRHAAPATSPPASSARRQGPGPGPRRLARVPRDGRQGARGLEGPLPRLPRRSAVDRRPVFGIRHHGPGSARGLVRALEELEPDVVLSRARPTPTRSSRWRPTHGMRPPVALLVYAPDEPRRAVFYPFATFSPEWQALRYALAARRARALHRPARRALDRRGRARAVGRCRCGSTRSPCSPRRPGYGDAERWWEDVVEHRRDELAAFEAVAEAMGALREGAEPETEHEARREAHMRRAIRAGGARGARADRRRLRRLARPRAGASCPTADARRRAAARACRGRRSPRPGSRGRTTGSRITSGYGAGVALARLVRPPVHDRGRRRDPLARRAPRSCCAARTSTPPRRT